MVAHGVVSDGTYNIYTLQGESELGRPYEYTITFISPVVLKVEDLVDTNVHIMLEDEKRSSEHRDIYGKVFEASEESIIADKYVYKLHVVHPLYYLGETKRYEIYQDMSVVEIINKVIKSYAGLLDLKFNPKVIPKPIREYTTQYHQSDLEFIQMLCQEEGVTLNLPSNASSFKVMMENINDTYIPFGGKLECDYNLSKSFKVSHMQEDYYDFKAPSLDYSTVKGEKAISQTFGDNGKSSQLRNDLRHYRLRDRLEESRSADGKRYSKQDSLQGYAHSEKIYGNSESLLTCDGYGGTLFEPKTYGAIDAIITKVVYDGFFPNAIEEHVEEVEEQRPWQFSCDFEAVPLSTTYIPPVTVIKPRIYSTVTARVSGGQSAEALNGGENTIDIDKFGRIRVIFHFDPQYPTSCYIRFTNISAGNGWGVQFIPRVNTEVVVSFLNGDPDRPISIGSLYNGENKIPEALPANKTKSYIKTQSLPGTPDQFNLLSFEDKGGKELVHMKAQKDHLLHVLHDSDNNIDHDERTVVGNDRTEHVKHNEDISIDNNRSEKVGVDETISIGNNRSEDVGVNEQISIGNNQAITVGNNRVEKVGNNEQIEIGNNRNVSIGKNESVTIGKNLTKTIGKNQKVKIKGNFSETVSKNKIETIALAKALTIGGAYQTTVGGIKNETVAISSSEQIGFSRSIIAGSRFEVSVGASSLIMLSDGTITLAGKDILIDGGGTTTIKGKMIKLN